MKTFIVTPPNYDIGTLTLVKALRIMFDVSLTDGKALVDSFKKHYPFKRGTFNEADLAAWTAFIQLMRERQIIVEERKVYFTEEALEIINNSFNMQDWRFNT